MKQTCLIALLLALGGASSMAVQQSNDPKNTPTPDRQPTPTASPSIGQSGPSGFGPVYLSGKVMLGDGGVPVESAKVELACHGAVQIQTYTDTSGDFSLRFDDRAQSVLGDASVGRPSLSGGSSDPRGQQGIELYRETPGGDLDLRGCEVRASLPGLQSSSIQLGVRGALDNPDVGTLILTRLSGGGTGSIVSLKSLAAPKEAKEAYEDAKKELTKKKKEPAKAVQKLKKAVEIYPEFAVAWELLGITQRELGQEREARQALRKAIEIEPKYISPYFTLAEMSINRGNWTEVHRLSSAVLEFEPGLTRARYLHANASFFLGELAVAEQEALKVQESMEASLYPATHFILGTVLAERGEWISARAEFDRFLEANPDAPVADGIRQQLQIWEKQGLFRPQP